MSTFTGVRLGLGIAIVVSSTTTYAQAPEQPRSYNLELDVTAGFSKIEGGEGGFFKIVGLQFERRLTEHLRVRGVLAAGGFASFDRFSGDYDAARAGLEGRSCIGSYFCFNGGLDAAVIHMTETEERNPNYMLAHTSPGAFIWGGIEVGGRLVRAHLAFDAGVDRRSDNAAGLLLGVSLQL